MKNTPPKWIQLQIWFSDFLFHSELSVEDRINLQRVFMMIDHQLKPYVNRRFFLYEPNPHVFFAFESKDQACYDKIYDLLRNFIGHYLHLHKFIDNASVKLNARDADNGEGFLNMMDSMTTFTLYHKDIAMSKLIHCMLNNAGVFDELNFYKDVVNRLQDHKREVIK